MADVPRPLVSLADSQMHLILTHKVNVALVQFGHRTETMFRLFSASTLDVFVSVPEPRECLVCLDAMPGTVTKC